MIHTDLDVYKLSMHLVKDVYVYCNSFPKSEDYGLSSQMKRAAISIPSNISEGCCRESDKELSKFLNYSLGSAAELETQMGISKMLGYCKDSTFYNEILGKLTRIRQMTLSLRRTVKARIDG